MAHSRILFLIAIFVIVLFSFTIVEATPVIKGPKLYTDRPVTGNYGNFVAVELTPSCLALAKINATSSCPTYKILEPFDTTDSKNAGDFFWDGLFFHKGKSAYKNYQLSYPKAKYPLVVCVDCSTGIIKYSKAIYVKSSDSFVFPIKHEKVINFTRTENNMRYVDAKCTTATITWNASLLNDTITYLASDCKTTHFNSTQTIYMPPSKLTYDGKEYKYQKWLEEAKKHKSENCLKSKNC